MTYLNANPTYDPLPTKVLLKPPLLEKIADVEVTWAILFYRKGAQAQIPTYDILFHKC